MLPIWPKLSPSLPSMFGVTAVTVSTQGQGCQIWDPNWVRLAPNEMNLGLFMIVEPKCSLLKLILKKSKICPIWGQSDPI